MPFFLSGLPIPADKISWESVVRLQVENQPNPDWVWSIHQLSTVFCLKLWREVEYCWFYLVFFIYPVGWVISCAGLKAILSWCSFFRRCAAAGFFSTRTTATIDGSCPAQLSGYALEWVDSFECLGRKWYRFQGSDPGGGRWGPLQEKKTSVSVHVAGLRGPAGARQSPSRVLL